jgi:FlaA1/EpsC-like NDP-sugar epimerase
MRLKLVLIASLIAAVAGAGSAIAIVLFALSSLESIASPGLLVVSTYLLPVLSTLFASIFVYRHTARRRKLQAALTVMISFVLTLAVFLAASMLTARSTPEQPPQPQRNVG